MYSLVYRDAPFLLVTASTLSSVVSPYAELLAGTNPP